jgi:hypothetical protein
VYLNPGIASVRTLCFLTRGRLEVVMFLTIYQTEAYAAPLIRRDIYRGFRVSLGWIGCLQSLFIIAACSTWAVGDFAVCSSLALNCVVNPAR